MTLTGERKREYQREWAQKRRQAWVEAQGHKCANCGNIDGPFDIDHIDPETKTLPIAGIWNRQEKIRAAELAKCQLLCEPCHQLKSNAENSTPLEHGTYNRGYRKGCKCPQCMESMRQHWREWRRK